MAAITVTTDLPFVVPSPGSIASQTYCRANALTSMQTTTLDQTQREQAADYVLNQLADSELAAVERGIKTDAMLRLAVQELSDAAAAIAYTSRQVLPPALMGLKIETAEIAEKVASKSDSGTDNLE